MTESAVKATVQKVFLNATGGPYVTAKAKGIRGSITFSLLEDVWQEHTVPQQGMIVVLSELHKRSAGWRAMSARLLTPADECPSAIEQPSRRVSQ